MLWGLINEEVMAEKQLRQLKQENRIVDYYAEFMAITAKLPWNEAPLMSQFHHGLKVTIKDLLVTVSKPQHIVDYLPICINLETRILERMVEQRTETQYSLKNNQNQKTTKVNASRLSPEERIRRMKEGLCFNCATKGHMARNCPMKTVQVKTTKEEKEGEEKGEKRIFRMVSASLHFVPDPNLI
jgi:hypothetical protein